MQIAMFVFGLLVASSAALAFVYPRSRGLLWFYFRLFHAQRRAARYYAECPWVTKNIAYHPAMSRRLDVYRPESGTDQPVVMYVYGGSWQSGNKELYATAAQRLVPSGLVLVIADYTLHPAAGYPRQTEEIAAALAWTMDNIAAYGGDPKRLVVVAQSAGAQIAALALLEPKWLAAYGHCAAEVRGFIGISGVFDMRAVVEHFRDSARARALLLTVAGGEANLDAASPVTFVTPAAPRTLLIHGDRDRTVPLRVAAGFHERLLAAGVDSQLDIYHGFAHADILFRALTDEPARLLNDITTFVQRCTEPQNQF